MQRPCYINRKCVVRLSRRCALPIIRWTKTKKNTKEIVIRFRCNEPSINWCTITRALIFNCSLCRRRAIRLHHNWAQFRFSFFGAASIHSDWLAMNHEALRTHFLVVLPEHERRKCRRRTHLRVYSLNNTIISVQHSIRHRAFPMRNINIEQEKKLFLFFLN